MKNFADELERIAIQVRSFDCADDSTEGTLDTAAAYLRLLGELRHETREVIRGRSKNCEKVRELLAQVEKFENEIELKDAGVVVMSSELVEIASGFVGQVATVSGEYRDADNVIPIVERSPEDWYGGI